MMLKDKSQKTPRAARRLPLLLLALVGLLLGFGIAAFAAPATMPTQLTAVSYSDTSVELESVAGLEYACFPAEAVSPSDAVWQSSPVFEGLTPKRAYVFLWRLAATETEEAGAPSVNGVFLTTKASAPAAPETPTLTERTDTTIALQTTPGLEYSVDGINWYANGIIEGLQPGTVYSVYARLSETDTAVAGLLSSPLTVKTRYAPPDAPEAPKQGSIRSDTEISILAQSGLEYSIDLITFQTDGTFSHLEPSTSYTVYARYPQTEDAMPSKVSSITISTKAVAPEAPTALVVQTRTDTEIQLKPEAGLEYSINGGQTWLANGFFQGLTPKTDYQVVARTSETYSTCAGKISAPITVTTRAPAPDAPAAPMVLPGKTDVYIQLAPVADCEYSKDGGRTWQSSPLFSNLTPGTTYSFCVRLCITEDTMPSRTGAIVYETTLNAAPAAPTGIIAETRTDTVAIFTSRTGLEYRLDGMPYQSSPAFTGLEPNTAYTLSVRVAATADTMPGEIATISFSTKASSPKAPAKPRENERTDTYLIVQANTACEFSLDGVYWSDSNRFDGLRPGTEYTVYKRLKETETAMMSEVSFETFTTRLPAPTAPDIPVLSSRTDTVVVVLAQAGFEYRISSSAAWRSDGVFENLTPNTSYQIFARIAETNTVMAGEISAPLSFTTKLSAAIDTPIPTIAERTDTVLSVIAVAGQEYSLDGEIWQDSARFSSLTPGVRYTIYTRLKETDTRVAGIPVSLEVTTKTPAPAAPPAPAVESKTATSLLLISAPGCEYRLADGTWQSTPRFENLTPGTTYLVEVRLAETDAGMVGESGFYSYTTKRTGAAAPEPPTIARVGASSIVVAALPGLEYRLGETGTWQTSPVFDGLAEYNSYFIYARVAETDDEEAGAESKPTLTHTLFLGGQAPLGVVLVEKGTDYLLLSAPETLEYSLDGESWQSSPRFEGLEPGKTYTLYARIPATVTVDFSASFTLEVTTKKAPAVGESIVLSTKTDTTLSFLLPSAAYEIRISHGTWQKNGFFENLQPGTAYDVEMRLIETDDAAAGIPSLLTVTTKKAAPAAPSAPTLSNATDTSILLTLSPGVEYSINGTDWQQSPLFSGLNPATEYSFFVRLSETDDCVAGVPGAPVSYQTKEKPPIAPTVGEVSAVTVFGGSDGAFTIENPLAPIEYSADGGETWQTPTSANVRNLTAGEYLVRYAESDRAVAGQTLTITILAPAGIPVDPEPGTVSAYVSTVTLTGCLPGQEYAIFTSDGKQIGTWYTADGAGKLTFEGLAEETSYRICARTAADAAHAASMPSVGLVITTKKTPDPPAAVPFASVETFTTVIVISGVSSDQEYILTDTNGRDVCAWKRPTGDTLTFSGLEKSTSYILVTRYYAKDGLPASPDSAPTAVTTRQRDRSLWWGILICDIAYLAYLILLSRQKLLLNLLLAVPFLALITGFLLAYYSLSSLIFYLIGVLMVLVWIHHCIVSTRKKKLADKRLEEQYQRSKDEHRSEN